MHAIDTAGSVNGKFSEGNPATGQRATKVGAAWLNDLQANVLAVLSEAGIQPTKGREGDLVDAIKSIAEGSSGTDGEGVPTTRKLLGEGLLKVSGSGDLAADRTLTVAKATSEEVAAGEADDKAITPAALQGSFNATLTENGTYRHPGGLIEKWGTVRGNYSEGSVYFPFPEAFPDACLNVVAIAINGSGSDRRDVHAQLVSRSKAGFTVFFQLGGGGSTIDSIDGIEWQAKGR